MAAVPGVSWWRSLWRRSRWQLLPGSLVGAWSDELLASIFHNNLVDPARYFLRP